MATSIAASTSEWLVMIDKESVECIGCMLLMCGNQHNYGIIREASVIKILVTIKTCS